jgi:Ca2+-binding EF-hand superfamily protein
MTITRTENAMRPTVLALTALLFMPAVLRAGDAPDAGRERGKRGERHARVLERFDTDRDGRLSEGERAAARAAIAARIQEKRPELFARLDTNHDGTLSAEELRAARDARRERRGTQP